VRPNRKSHCLLLDPPEDLVVSTGFAVLTPTAVGPSFLYGMTERPQFVDYLIASDLIPPRVAAAPRTG
jgi:type I restriction enzyme S subunit